MVKNQAEPTYNDILSGRKKKEKEAPLLLVLLKKSSCKMNKVLIKIYKNTYIFIFLLHDSIQIKNVKKSKNKIKIKNRRQALDSFKNLFYLHFILFTNYMHFIFQFSVFLELN